MTWIAAIALCSFSMVDDYLQEWHKRKAILWSYSIDREASFPMAMDVNWESPYLQKEYNPDTYYIYQDRILRISASLKLGTL
jgi:hypothetical protein